MPQFVTELFVKCIDDDRWELTGDLIYQSDICPKLICVPKGFVTDFASVPRIPFAYWLAGGCADKAAVIHDYLYRTGAASKDVADDIFFEAMGLQGISFWRRYGMYWAVRLFGGSSYKGAK
jgi:hypothetical protein